jgi:hypothetical protein
VTTAAGQQEADGPNIARVYDDLVGGSHNLDADRLAAAEFLARWPDARRTRAANRAFLGRVVRDLPGRDPASARDARRRAEAVLASWGLGEQADAGELVADELLANALCHDDAPVWIRLSVTSGGLRVEVHASGVCSPTGMPLDTHEDWEGWRDLLDAAKVCEARVPTPGTPPPLSCSPRASTSAWCSRSWVTPS